MALKLAVYEICRKCGAVDARIEGDYVRSGLHDCPVPKPEGPPTPRGGRWPLASIIWVPQIKRIAASPLSAANRICGQMRCDCGGMDFMVGLSGTEEGSNFIRILECSTCGMQHQVVHKSNAQIEPAIAARLKAVLS